MSRRRFARWTIGAGAGLPVLTGATQALAADLMLLVFVPTDARVRSFEKQLTACLPGVNVRAVSRFRDFESSLQSGTDAVLTLQPVLEQLKLAVSAQGKRKGGDSKEPYLLVSTGAPVVPSTVGKLGAVDILGHSGMKGFVAQVSGASPKIKSVIKIEDLLPLLQLQAVDAVLMPERYLPTFQTNTQLDLRPVRVGSAGLPALATLTPRGRSIVPLVHRLTASINAQMGVSEWTVLG